MVQLDAWTHRRGDACLLDVDALGTSRLEALEFFDNRLDVLGQVVWSKADLANRNVHVRELVGTELDLATLELFDCLCNVWGNSAGLWVRHEATWTEDSAELTNDRHHVRSGDRDVEVEHSAFDLLCEIFSTDELCASVTCSLRGIALGEHGNANSLAGTGRKRNSAANHLVGLAWVYSETKNHVDGFVVVPLWKAHNDVRCIAHRMKCFTVIAACSVLILLTLRHDGSLYVWSRT